MHSCIHVQQEDFSPVSSSHFHDQFLVVFHLTLTHPTGHKKISKSLVVASSSSLSLPRPASLLFILIFSSPVFFSLFLPHSFSSSISHPSNALTIYIWSHIRNTHRHTRECRNISTSGLISLFFLSSGLHKSSLFFRGIDVEGLLRKTPKSFAIKMYEFVCLLLRDPTFGEPYSNAQDIHVDIYPCRAHPKRRGQDRRRDNTGLGFGTVQSSLFLIRLNLHSCQSIVLRIYRNEYVGSIHFFRFPYENGPLLLSTITCCPTRFNFFSIFYGRNGQLVRVLLLLSLFQCSCG